jgi:hypothetical protein
MIAVAQRQPTKRSFKLSEPFTFDFGDTAEGPDGLSIWFSGVGKDDDGKNPCPDFSFKRGGRTLDRPFWSRSLTKGSQQPVARGLIGGLIVTILRTAQKEPYATTMSVTKPRTLELKWGHPLQIAELEFAIDPEGRLWTLSELPHRGAGDPRLGLRVRQKQSESEDTLDLRPGEKGVFGPEAWNDVLVSAALPQDAKALASSVRLEITKPSLTVKPLSLGQPVVLRPKESAKGPGGLSLTLEGYGHKMTIKGGDLLLVSVALKQGREEDHLYFYPSRAEKGRPASQEWKGWSITLQECTDQGPPHSSTATSTFVVRRAARP